MRKLIKDIYLFIFIVFLYLPIFILILFSFNSTKGRTFTGFSFKWYESLFYNANIVDGLITTLIIALVSSIISTGFGTISALGLYNLKGSKKKTLLNFTYLPILNPEIITGVSFMLLFVSSKEIMNYLHLNFEFGYGTLIISHVSFCMPYVILSVLPKLSQLDRSLVDSAMDLGCNKVQTFIKVILPEIKTGIFSGFLMAITFSVDDFVVSYFTTGVNNQPLSVLVYSMTKKRISPEINALSTLLFAIVVVLILLIKLYKKTKYKNKGIIATSILIICTFVSINLVNIQPSFAESNNHNIDINQFDKNYYSRFKGKNQKLYVYNWGEYMSLGQDGFPNLVKKFEKLTGIDIIYSNFETNEGMYSKIKSKAGNYDLIIPSDYTIDRMIRENMLEKLDFNNIPNFKYIDPNLKNPLYDKKNQYSVPYAFGITALVYNKKLMDYKPDSWKALWDEDLKGDILMFKNSRDSFAIAEAMLDISLNDSSEKNLKRAKELLVKQKPLVQGYIQDQIFDKMEKEEAVIAPCYVGDAYTIMANNKNIDVAIPKETKNIFVDALVIPKGAKNKEAAEMFINFLNEPIVAAINMEYIMYSSPNLEAQKLLPKEISQNKILYPEGDVLKSCTPFVNLTDEGNLTMDRLWSQLLLPGNNTASKFILFIIILGLFALYIRAKIMRKKKKKYM